MTASTGSPEFSSFSVLCASAYTVKPLMVIRPSSFFPQPNVDSMGVLLEKKSSGTQIPDVFFRLVRALFSSRRKTIKNNLTVFLSSIFGDLDVCPSLLSENGLTGNERAENLDFESFLSLAKSIENMRK